MRSAELGKVGKKIREIRKRRKMNLQEVAQKSDITAGLLSRIENFKTLPSLPVLHKISIALEVPLSDLVHSVGPPRPSTYFLIRNGRGDKEKDPVGIIERQLLNTGFSDVNIQVRSIEIPAETQHQQKGLDQMELFHLVNGSLSFQLKKEAVQLERGDTLFVDGKTLLSINNNHPAEARIFKVILSKA